ncbi:E3 SUMO-protein ligase PIAS2 [Hondaea fermentalgiana]|uniref:E3 SUMO-protein ligase PIAS2 n=1 Tax=Hondaea fermentalgiana TaxID=2315210 RepID=A0A2R5GMM5_9STRA|nr:E3 SUMO-protein ligase PIAS2 [Hondaea fermentalgiana]|eukprot:GBG32152.1 E3 SUMO-protein ligase PIAS2 [Hondaea fermentalgiana]
MVSLSQVPRSLLMEPDVQVLVYCVQVAKGRKELEEDRKLVNAGKSLPMQAKVVRWPPAAAVYANQKAVKLIQQAPDGRLRTKAVRERPADITKFVSSSSQKANLRITHPYCELRDEGARFAISVVVSRRLTTPRLLERLTTTPYDHSLKLVRDVFGDGEIEMGQVAVSLRDNVTFMPIEVPVRGKDCTHVQCFDAGGFLDFQRVAKNAQFRCPVCNKAPLFPANLRTDPWFTEIIQKVRDSGDSVDKVEYFSDGRWQPYVEGSLDSAAPSSNSSEPRGLKRPGSLLESDRQPSLPVLQSLTPEQDSRPATPQLPDSMPGSREDDDGAIVILDSDDDE